MLTRRPPDARRLSRDGKAALVVVVVLVALLAHAVAVRADIGGQVTCTALPQPAECKVIVVVIVDGEDGHAGGGGGAMRCSQGGRQVPCFVAGQGWLHSDGCRYLRQGSVNPPPGAASGAWYARNCSLSNGGATTLVWFANGDAPGIGPVVSTAVARLRPAVPDIRMSPRPPAAALVFVPTWLWVDGATWTSPSATASAAGMAITATATPVSVTWLPGDGTRLVCAGPGVAWTGGADPLGSSACSHTYRRPSTSLLAGTYVLRATVMWRVTWQGAGMSGTAQPLITTATVPVRVAESQGLNVEVPR